MSLSPGLYIAKDGVDVLGAVNQSDFVFNSEWDTYKYLQLLTASITVNDFVGTGVNVTSSSNITIPSDFSFSPHFFSWIVPSTGPSQYDFCTTNSSSAFVGGNASGGTLTAFLTYASGGTTTYTLNFYVYIFGNAVE